jgi:hypothetical protein
MIWKNGLAVLLPILLEVGKELLAQLVAGAERPAGYCCRW